VGPLRVRPCERIIDGQTLPANLAGKVSAEPDSVASFGAEVLIRLKRSMREPFRSSESVDTGVMMAATVATVCPKFGLVRRVHRRRSDCARVLEIVAQMHQRRAHEKVCQPTM
jgi:hypothetical protein